MHTTAEAAKVLGVDERQIRHLINSRAVAATMSHGGAWEVDPLTVRAASRAKGRGRRWAEHTAWAALEILGERDTRRIGTPERSRLRSALRHCDATRLAYRAGLRGTVYRLAWHNGRRQDLAARLALTGTSALESEPGLASRFGLIPSPSQMLLGYANPAATAVLVKKFILKEDPRGSLLLQVADQPVVNDATVALDLYCYGDTRESAAGRRHLEQLLSRGIH